jgi:hypothetical protein
MAYEATVLVLREGKKMPDLMELVYLRALKRIVKDYMTPDQLRRKCESRAGYLGLTYTEALEMAYENMQMTAAGAIKAKRIPKSKEARHA